METNIKCIQNLGVVLHRSVGCLHLDSSSNISKRGPLGATDRAQEDPAMVSSKELTSEYRCSTVVVTLSSIASKRLWTFWCSLHQPPLSLCKVLAGSAAVKLASSTTSNRNAAGMMVPMFQLWSNFIQLKKRHKCFRPRVLKMSYVTLLWRPRELWK